MDAHPKASRSINPLNPDGPPLLTQVFCERDRRIAQGMEIFLKSGKVVSVATASLEDFRNINYAATTTLSLIARTVPQTSEEPVPAATPPPTVHFRDYFRQPVELTYEEMTELGVRVTDAAHLYNEAAHALQDMDPIPDDFMNDSYWPNIPLPPQEERA